MWEARVGKSKVGLTEEPSDDGRHDLVDLIQSSKQN